MASVGNIWVNLRMRNKTASDLKKALGQIRSQVKVAGMAMTAAVSMFGAKGIKEASDFAENWSVVTNSVGKDIQSKFLDAFKGLKRITKSQFADISATIVGTLKSKGIDDAVIGQMGPQILKRLEDTGAFYNKTADEVLHAFTSMISGMARPMEMLTKGAVVPLVKNLDRFAEQDYGMKFEQLTPDEQTLLRLKYFLDGTAKVPFLVNNSAKTIGTWKGQMDAMKKSVADTSAEFGRSLMPVLTKILPILTKMANFISKNANLIIALGIAFASFKLGSFVGQMIKAIALLLALATAKTLSKATLFAIPVVAGLAAGAVGLIAGLTGIGGVSFSGGGSGANQMPAPEITIQVSGNAQVDSIRSNGKNFQSQDNFGAGNA